ncbi:hypothetical protein N7495_009718 [Penicillium taxi]|uniref:uncharacterized protein n=1 Tax=Penicillium taxi TaxID=168475 RepID=UPI002544D55B|nr:uncharacterized protein N7495_009718 [Penicillium taxi]KAJ5885208.1 hypothetical protein N7495_009718 [Penicillium taxi]
MSSLALSLVEGFKGRRSIYPLTNESTVSNDRIEELISEATLHSPSPFNTQASRVVVLLRNEHEKLWDLAGEIVSATVPAEQFEKLYKPRIAGFRAAYGTALFYTDFAPFNVLGEKWPMLKEKFPEWADHASGMHQLTVWTLLEAEGLGANLQHYNPMIDVEVSKQWNVPKEWKLKAQLVFGKPSGPAREKTFEPIHERVFVYGK